MRMLESLKKGNLANSVLVEANFRGSKLGKSNFKNSDLRGANFHDTHLAKTQFQNYNLEEADLMWTVKGALFLIMLV